jgi:glycosyltransferase involved in cell wall biosynthesis
MKIFLYTPFYPPQSSAAAVRGYWLTKTLMDAGHVVQVCSSIKTKDSFALNFNPADNKQSFAKRLLFEVFAGIELFTKIFLSSYQLYILSTPPFITVSIAHLACRLRKKSYVIDVRDIYPDVYFAQGLIKENSFLGRMVKSFTASMYKNSVGVTTVTNGLVKKISTLSPTTKTELLMNGFDADLFKPSSEKYEKFTVVFHGNMGKVQNLQAILDVAKILEAHEDIEFLFAGEGPQAELLKNSSLKNIRYLGAQDYSNIPSIIAQAHVGFSARRDDEIGTDALPVKAFEYLGVGIPVIMTPKAGILTEIVKDGVFEFSNQELNLVAQKILELKSNPIQISSPDKLSRQQVSKKILGFCDL